VVFAVLVLEGSVLVLVLVLEGSVLVLVLVLEKVRTCPALQSNENETKSKRLEISVNYGHELLSKVDLTRNKSP